MLVLLQEGDSMRCKINVFAMLIILVSRLPPLFSNQQDSTKTYRFQDVNIYADRQMRSTQYYEIVARIPLPLHETPASIGIITQQCLKDRNSTNLSDALATIGGINIQSGLGTHDYFLIRGFESVSSGLVVMDGTRIPNLSLFRFYGFGRFDLYNVSQIEVWKGPSGFLYGAGALSGTVNLSTKKAIVRNFAESSLSHSTYQAYRETIDLGFFDQDSGRALRINGVWQNVSGFRQSGSDWHYAITPVLHWDFKGRGTVAAALEYGHGQIKPDLGIPLYVPGENWQIPEVPRTSNYQTVFDRVEHDVIRGRVEYKREIGRAILRDKIYFGALQGDARFTLMHIPLRTIAGSWRVERHMYCFTEDQRYWGNQLEYFIPFKIGLIEHQLLTGLECAVNRTHSVEWTTMLQAVDLFDPRDDVKDFNQLLSSRVHVHTRTRTVTAAPYFVDSVWLWKKIRVLCGARVDHVDFYTDRQQNAFDYIGRSLSSKPMPFEKRSLALSPMVGVVIRDSEKLWFLINAGRSFGPGTRMIDDHEVSKQYEAGFKYYPLHGRMALSGTVYHLRKENMSIPLQTPVQGDLYTTSGCQESAGFELECTIQSPYDIFLSGSYSFTDANLVTFKALSSSQYGKLVLEDFSGRKPVFVPAHLLACWVTKLLRNGLGFGLGVRYVSDQYINLDNTLTMPGYPLWNAMVQYDMRHYRLQVNFDNLSDERFWTRGLGAFSLIPGGYRAVHGTLEMKF
jgi:outer membrane receptor for monomeric catechols